MHDLIVVGFRGKERASEVLTQLMELAYGGTLDLFDAVAAHRTDDGKVRIDEFVKQVGGMIQPGDSAVFAVLEAKNRERVIEEFHGYGGTVLRTTLPPDVMERVQNSLQT